MKFHIKKLSSDCKISLSEETKRVIDENADTAKVKLVFLLTFGHVH